MNWTVVKIMGTKKRQGVLVNGHEALVIQYNRLANHRGWRLVSTTEAPDATK